MDEKELRLKCLELAEKRLEHCDKMKGQLVTTKEQVLGLAKIFENYVKGN